MGLQIDGATVSALLIGLAALLTYLINQTSSRARDQRSRLRALTRREIAWARWGHRVQVWAASRGHTDLPEQPSELTDDREDS
ncbi:MAG: hypothetical protein ACRCYU_12275 [Nocardioides sp.]